ncbi:helix-turn-helix transcriptional regulator [Gallaecimonas kandeliae]|uniref:helix-turn-helix domain-containing protein n=1 Tax=Gallaecimonas kandeliae TaxID=3029055 RepID=UPI0026486A8E|nr:helix-turn-helix transcriptional regulator [Gallaecimonas kandeliae]WKE65793.1 helix-turn-helix transcriptional regulator [Gallaecimonas kandeliae]
MQAKDESPFSRRLKEARLASGYSQKSLGIAAGIDEFAASARMNQYERGVHAPDFLTVRAIARVLNLPTAFFYCEEEELAEMIKVWQQGRF